jgi:glycoprotein endo-alpha-1,2-mannosidase
VRLLLTILVVLSALCGCSRPAPGPLQTERYLVGAYYYLWFPGNFRHGYLRKYLDPPQQPALGLYASTNPAVAEQHIAWAAPHGIDFFAIDWWPSRPGQNEAFEAGFLRARNVGDIQFCLFYETWALGFDKDLGCTSFDADKRRAFVADMDALADRFFNHPSYLKVGGRPVVILYLSRTFSGDFAGALREARRTLKKRGHDVFFVGDEVFWNVTPVKRGRPHPLVREPQAARIRALDAITSYNLYENALPQHAGYGSRSRFIADVAEIYRSYRAAARGRACLVPGLIPGYNDRGVRRGQDHFVIPRQWDRDAGEGSFLAHGFEKVGLPLADSRLNMILLTSWNEWNEDTAIEPLATAPPTARDGSRESDFFTKGFAYAGHGMAYLETVRDQVLAVTGRVLHPDGSPAAGAIVAAWSEGAVVARDTARSDGSFRLSRLRLPPGRYEVGASEFARTAVEVLPRRTATGVVLRAAAGLPGGSGNP